MTKSAGAALDRLDRILHRAVTGDDDRDDVGIALDRGFDDGGSVDAGQPQVGDDDVEREIGETRRGRPRPIRPARPRYPWSAELLGDRLAQRRLVFDEEQMFRTESDIYGSANILTAGRSGPASHRRITVACAIPNRSHPIPTFGGRLPVERKTISIMKACELVGVSRRTIYNWLASGKIEYVRTAGGSVRIFVDTLWRDPNDSTRPAVSVDVAGGGTEPGLMPFAAVSVEELLARDRWTNLPNCGRLFHRLNNQLGHHPRACRAARSEGPRRNAARARRRRLSPARSRPWARPRRFAASPFPHPTANSCSLLNRNCNQAVKPLANLMADSSIFDEFHGLTPYRTSSVRVRNTQTSYSV